MDQSEKEARDQESRSLGAVINLYVKMTSGSRVLFACALSLLAVSLLMYLAFAIAVGKLVDGAL